MTSDFRLQTSDFPNRAAELIARFPGLPILVVGDVMLDRFIVGRVTRISPEAPVPVVQFESEHLRLGGAANVANNIAVLGGRAMLVGTIGADIAGVRLCEQLSAVGIGVDGLVEDPGRPTTEKVRVVTERNQQVARIDYERDADVAGDIERMIVERVKRLGPGARTLLVSDYLKGSITRAVIEALLDVSRSAPPSRGTSFGERSAVPLIIDPKIPHLASYAGATLITPNHQEAETATHRRLRTDADAREAARDFRERAKCDGVLITRGEHGMWLSDATAEGSIPAITREVSDVTGAGDTVVATLALALAAGATTTEAAMLANQAAGIVVGKFGPATVTPSELLSSLKIHHQQSI
jgi:D-beta-D-heptose 7-phosphate kinase/D-beta-D-heptose 1-phosphate adenosyltransferase